MDELEKLRAALKSAPPPTDPMVRAATLAGAMTKFDDQVSAPQGTADEARPTSDRPRRAGFLTGVRRMLSRPATRPALAAAASVAALFVGVLVVQPSLWRKPEAKAPPVLTEAPAAPVATVAPPAPEAKTTEAPKAEGAAAPMLGQDTRTAALSAPDPRSIGNTASAQHGSAGEADRSAGAGPCTRTRTA